MVLEIIKGTIMQSIQLYYRSKKITSADIEFIAKTIQQNYELGRSKIARILCEAWEWRQPNGSYKEYAARDLLLRLEEKKFIELPPRLRPKNNLKKESYEDTPLFFIKRELTGSITDFPSIDLQIVTAEFQYLWEYLLHEYHYLGLPRFVGEHIKYIAWIDDVPAAAFLWASAAWKAGARDTSIGWDVELKRKNLIYVANNSRFLIPPWIQIKCLASRLLSLCLKRLSEDWKKRYAHPVYLAETFVDISRFKGTCYQASNWIHVGFTKGHAKRGNSYAYHGIPKAIYLYPLHHDFRRLLNNDEG